MEAILGFLILVAIVAFSDIVSNVTKARVPMLAVALFTYMLLTWVGMPRDLLQVAHAKQFAALIIPMLIVHMGTLLPFKTLKEQWKAILIGLGAIAGIVLMVVGVGGYIVGYASSVAAVGPLAGGLIAGVITMQGLNATGLGSLLVITGIVLGVQGIIGMPLASNILKKHASKVKVKETPESESGQEVMSDDEEPKKGLLSIVPAKYFSNTVLLLFVIGGGTAAMYLENLTGGEISYSIFALIIGIIGAYFGFFHKKILNKSNSFGILMLLLIVFVLPVMMNRVTPSTFTELIGPAFLLIALGITGLMIGGYTVGKILGWDWTLTIPVATTALYGFPGDYLLCQEVARTAGETEEHKKAIMDETLPPMIVGGFTTVTIASIVVASYLVGTL